MKERSALGGIDLNHLGVCPAESYNFGVVSPEVIGLDFIRHPGFVGMVDRVFQDFTHLFDHFFTALPVGSDAGLD